MTYLAPRKLGGRSTFCFGILIRQFALHDLVLA